MCGYSPRISHWIFCGESCSHQMNTSSNQRFLICLSLCSFAASCDVLIRDATVIDVLKGTRLHKYSVLIHGDKIAAVGPGIAAPKQAVVVEGAGKYVIPGMWDMHVQIRGREQLPLYLAYGVTGVRDMGSELAHVKAWRAEIEKAEFRGPHIETCGPLADGFPSDDPKLPVMMVRSPAEARSMFDQ